MPPGIFFAFLMFTNTLTTELTNPQPRLTYGVLSDEFWPVIPRGNEQTTIRVNSENGNPSPREVALRLTIPASSPRAGLRDIQLRAAPAERHRHRPPDHIPFRLHGNQGAGVGDTTVDGNACGRRGGAAAV